MADGDGSKRVTIYEVAAAAGVSITTVSHALNRPERVRAETRARVLEVIDQLDFVPEQVAAQRNRKTPQIAVLAPFDAYPTYTERLLGAMSVFGDSARVVVFDHSAADSDLSPVMQALPISGRIDGLIVMGLPLGERMVRRLIDRSVPTVVVDARRPELASVTIDDEAGGALAVEHLLRSGHDRIAYVTGPQSSADYVSPGALRLRGAERALAASGRSLDALPIVLTDAGFDGGHGAVAHLRREYPDVTAVLCHFDEIAAGMLKGLRESRVEVPGDLAVMGYDDGLLAQALDLTSIRQPLRRSGQVAARLLLERIEGAETEPEHVVLLPELQVRGTA